MGKNIDYIVRQTGLEAILHSLLLAGLFWANYLTYLSLDFLNCKVFCQIVGKVRGNDCKITIVVPGTQKNLSFLFPPVPLMSIWPSLSLIWVVCRENVASDPPSNSASVSIPGGFNNHMEKPVLGTHSGSHTWGLLNSNILISSQHLLFLHSHPL